MCAMITHSSTKDVSMIPNKADNRARKKRIVKNGYVDVDNVSISAGDLYSEWIKISKRKLLEREGALMKIRINKIQAIVNKEIEKYLLSTSKNQNLHSSHHYFISKNTLSLVQTAISNTTESWNGIDLNKRKSGKPYHEFREYFNVAKNWWDQRKTNILGQSFWSPALIELQQFVRNRQCIFGGDILLWKILNSLFHETVKYPNTKQQPLIPNGVIKNCKQIHQFFFGLNQRINIRAWLKQEIILEKKLDARNNQNRKRTGNAKIIAQTLRNMLTQLSNNDKGDHQKLLKQEPQMLQLLSPSSTSPIATESVSNNKDRMRSERIKTKTTSVVLPTTNAITPTMKLSVSQRRCNRINDDGSMNRLQSNMNHNLKHENIRFNPINNSIKTNSIQQTPDYNQIIFALADQFMINKNNMNNTPIPQNIVINNNVNSAPTNHIVINNINMVQSVPNIGIIAVPVHGQNNHRHIMSTGNNICVQTGANHTPSMGYNAIHLTQYQVSSM